MNIRKLTDMFIISGTPLELEQLQEEVSGLSDAQLVELYRRSAAEVASGRLPAEEAIVPMASALAAAVELVRRGKGVLLDWKK